MTEPGPMYYGYVAEGMRRALANDPREPAEWADGDKLRLLAALFDQADIIKGSTDSEVQNDLRRIAIRLDILEGTTV